MNYYVRRFAAWYIDIIIVMICSVLIQVLINHIGPESWKIENPTAENWVIIQFVVMFLYYIILETLSRITLGKLILKLKIVGVERKKLNERFFQILVRTIVRFIPFEPFSIFLNEEKVMWHDRLSKTKVIDIQRK